MAKRSPTLTLAPLWTHKDKNGQTFYAGPILGNLTLMVFPIPVKDRVEKGPTARAVLMIGESQGREPHAAARSDEDVPF